MNMRNCWRFLLLFICQPSFGQVTYYADILGHGFRQATIVQPSDYEGSVTCTIVRKLAPQKSTKAVLYVHGFNDYFFQEEMADQFNAQGFNFYAVDLRKYGRSWLGHQKRGNVRDLSEYYADLDTALALIRNEGSTQTILSGHDLGGLTAALYAHARSGSERFDAVLLNSPLFGLNIKSAGFIAKRADKHPDSETDPGISAFYGESLYHNLHGAWDYNLTWKSLEAPPVTFGWVKAVSDALATVSAGLQINKPVLVLHAAQYAEGKKWSDQFLSADIVTDVQAIAAQSKNIQGQYSVQAVPGGIHDLLLSRQPVRDEVYSTIMNWTKRVIL